MDYAGAPVVGLVGWERFAKLSPGVVPRPGQAAPGAGLPWRHGEPIRAGRRSGSAGAGGPTPVAASGATVGASPLPAGAWT